MNRVAVVTGGSSGIGLATVKKFAEENWTVYGLSRHAMDYDDKFVGTKHMICDVTDEQSVKETFEYIISQEGKIDVLVCNAGFGISGALEFTKVQEGRKIFDVNYFGGLNCAQAVIPCMREMGQGKIIFTSSVAAIMPIPFQGFYSATKAAINMMAGALRNEVAAFGIQVCCVMPGDVKTGFTKAREKSFDGEKFYGKSIEKSVAVMEHDEESGMEPRQIAKIIYKVVSKKRIKPLYTPGVMYKGAVVLGKILPTSLVYWLIKVIYVKK